MKVQETLLCPVGDRWDTRVYTEERLVASKGEGKKREKDFFKKKEERRGRKEKRKKLAEEGKKKKKEEGKRSDAGSALRRVHGAILEGGHRDIILDYLYSPR